MVASLTYLLNNRGCLRIFRSFSHDQKIVAVVPAMTLAHEREGRRVALSFFIRKEKFPRNLQHTYISLVRTGSHGHLCPKGKFGKTGNRILIVDLGKSYFLGLNTLSL